MSTETPYTPHTTMVRLSYIVCTKDDGDPDWTREEAKAEFTRWLAAEKAKAVREAAEALDNETDFPFGSMSQTAAVEWLRAYAETKGATP